MLYLVGTPIGNLQDVTLRGLEILKSVDLIACEDTRHSAPFLNYYNIHTALLSYHKFNEKEQTQKLLELLKEGKSIALITDAGMPCISDPGSILVQTARKEGVEIQVIPGPTAVTSALSLSGVSGGFVFIGFLPEKKNDVKAKLAPFITSPLPLVFYCGCHDLDRYSSTLYEILGDRDLTVVKELTKIHEGVFTSKLSEGYDGDKRGEFVLIVSGYEEKEDFYALSVEEHLKAYLKLGLSKKDAVKKVASERDLKKDEVYKIAMTIE